MEFDCNGNCSQGLVPLAKQASFERPGSMKTASNELQPPATPPQNRLSRTRTGRKLKVYLRAIPPEMDDDGYEGNDVVAERDIGQGEGRGYTLAMLPR